MAEIFKKFGAIVLAFFTLVSFTGVLLERDFCLPCGSENEEIHFFANFLTEDLHQSCACSEMPSEFGHHDNCCDNETHQEHTDIVKVWFAKVSTNFLQYSIKSIAKPFIKLITIFIAENDSSQSLIVKASAFFNDSFKEAPPNHVSQPLICVYLI